MQKGESGTEQVGLEQVKFMRNAFRSWMESATLMHDQGERTLNLVLKQGQGGYDEWRNILGDWANSYKKARDQFQKTVEESLAKMEEFLAKKE